MPRFADTPEHAVDLCEGYAETERGLEEKYTKKAEDAHVRREQYNKSRIARGSSAPLHPAPQEVKYLQEAERYARQAQKYESKAKTIRDLIASGKIQPDTPEVREEREQRKQERVARLRERFPSLR
jgi:hypothetical protein